MRADDLRSIQAPLKERYRETPDAALITLRAQGRIGEGVSCKIETGKALVACAGVTLSYCVVYQTLAHPPSLSVTRR